MGRKYHHDWLYLLSMNSDKHLSQSPFIGHIFYDDILLWCLDSEGGTALDDSFDSTDSSNDTDEPGERDLYLSHTQV